MTEETRRVLRRDAERNRQRVLTAARELFAEKGLEATLNDVARHANVGVGTVYRRFATKEELIEAIFVDGMEQLTALAKTALQHEDSWSGFAWYVASMCEITATDRGLREIAFSKVYGGDRVKACQEGLVPVLTALVERAQRDGHLRPELSSTDMPLLGLLSGTVSEFAGHVDPELWRRYVAILLEGMRCQPGQSPIPVQALDGEALDAAMRTWAAGRAAAVSNGNPRADGAQLFCGVDLARRIEKAEADLIVAATHAAGDRGADGLVLPVAGGFACFAEADSPMNKVVGLGFEGVPDEAVLGEIERAFAARGSETRVELSNLADPEIAALLSGRGYRLVEFENVLGRPVGDEGSPVTDVQVRRAEDLTAWVNVVVEGFAHPDDGPVSHEQFPADILERAERDIEKAGATAYVALRDGVVAGGGMMRRADGIAQLCGAATAPAHRRRGVQAALLAARLAEAADAGCEIAVVTTAPGSKSQHNVQRRGFQLLYTRAILVKPVQ